MDKRDATMKTAQNQQKLSITKMGGAGNRQTRNSLEEAYIQEWMWMRKKISFLTIYEKNYKKITTKSIVWCFYFWNLNGCASAT